MNEQMPERPENYECTIAGDESRGRIVAEMRAMVTRWKKKENEYKKSGYEVLHTVCKRDGKHETDYYFLNGPTGYIVQKNGKTIITARTRDELAKEAYIRSIVGYYTRVEIGQGKAAAERAKKDPTIQNLLRKRNESGY